MNCTGWVFIFAQLTCVPIGAAPDTFCQIAKPITWSANDTRLTKAQADIHNRKGKKLCGWGKPKN